jgi:hypothetical protein
MTERAPRYDGYGQTIAPLVDVRQESLVSRAANQQAITAILSLLKEHWPIVLQRGWHGRLTLDIPVRDGMIAQDIDITERRSTRIRE